MPKPKATKPFKRDWTEDAVKTNEATYGASKPAPTRRSNINTRTHATTTKRRHRLFSQIKVGDILIPKMGAPANLPRQLVVATLPEMRVQPARPILRRKARKGLTLKRVNELKAEGQWEHKHRDVVPTIVCVAHSSITQRDVYIERSERALRYYEVMPQIVPPIKGE